jgi:hypothetical protein
MWRGNPEGFELMFLNQEFITGRKKNINKVKRNFEYLFPEYFQEKEFRTNSKMLKTFSETKVLALKDYKTYGHIHQLYRELQVLETFKAGEKYHKNSTEVLAIIEICKKNKKKILQLLNIHFPKTEKDYIKYIQKLLNYYGYTLQYLHSQDKQERIDGKNVITRFYALKEELNISGFIRVAIMQSLMLRVENSPSNESFLEHWVIEEQDTFAELPINHTEEYHQTTLL